MTSDVSATGLRIRSGTIASRTLWGFTVIDVGRTQTRLDLVVAPHGALLEGLLPKGALAVLNAGYFDADYRPTTWVVAGGRQLSPQSDTSRGGVFAIAGARFFVGPFAGLPFAPELAVQSFPLIVEPGGTPGIRRDDGRRAARTVVCATGSDLAFVVLAAPRGDGPTLFEAMALLRDAPPRGFGCHDALNLDGGPSTGVVFAPGIAARPRPPLAPVAYAIAILPAA